MKIVCERCERIEKRSIKTLKWRMISVGKIPDIDGVLCEECFDDLIEFMGRKKGTEEAKKDD